ncbi:MAG: hypothetical protein KBE96_00645 [Bacteroidales bacterium]|nr:hypothetical protein [Bacteroidales bacterium]
MIKFRFEYGMILIYLLLGSGWILFSDELTELLAPNPEVAAHFQTYKGLFYVFVTAFLFYGFLRKHLQKLRKAEEKALESDRLKSGFLANVSHEIRTPMNGVMGFAELLKDESLTNEQRLEYISVIERSGERMLDLINDIVNISMIDTEQVRLHLSNVDTSELVTSLAALFEPAAIEKGVSLKFSPCSGDGMVGNLLLDREKVICVLSILIKNALKYTSNGSIEVSCRREADIVRFTVKDTGIGIPEGQLEAIFNRFVQVNMSYTKTYDGAGLGLAIAKSFVEIMGGKIWAESYQGSGSIFNFTIPYKTSKDLIK